MLETKVFASLQVILNFFFFFFFFFFYFSKKIGSVGRWETKHFMGIIRVMNQCIFVGKAVLKIILYWKGLIQRYSTCEGSR